MTDTNQHARQLWKVRVDKRIVRAIKDSQVSIETILFDYCKERGLIDREIAPLGNLRGGKRVGAGRKRVRERVQNTTCTTTCTV